MVFLDNPKTGVRLASLKGKKVIICSDIDGCEFVHTLPVEREELLNYFSAISKDPKIFQCSSNAEIALSVNSFNPACTAFALEVFRQIGLLDFSGGTAAFIRGSKRNLEDSKLYKTVQDYENLTR